jgi:hypothetical protein
MMNKEQQLRLLQHCRWLLVVLCFCCCCTAKHGTAIAFTNAAIAATRGGANTASPTAPTSYADTKHTDHPIDEIRYATISTQQAAATSEAPPASKMNSDSSADNISSFNLEDPSQVRLCFPLPK